MGVLVNSREGPSHQVCSFTWADNNRIMSHSKAHLEQMLKDLIEDAERWDVEPKPASLWWTSTYASEMMEDITIGTRTGQHCVRFKKNFKILGYTFNQAGQTQDYVEERMQSANKAWWRDVTIYRSKDVPWRAKCRRKVEHVKSVFCFGSENWSWSQAIFDRNIKGGKQKAMRRSFRIKKARGGETWVTVKGRHGRPERFGQR